ncbi:MAG: hypothetical protein A2163_00870 [Actinobacteria bacterium RBG_13_35_12]|nr:MAG: hypothetical protein A2163_00870 [Actinobacteria bacterium RBG_13_35_12]
MNKKDIYLTFDVDWAKDKEILKVWDMLRPFNIKSTWFMTHQSDALKKLSEHTLVETGIHPNLNIGSTQCSKWDQILNKIFHRPPTLEIVMKYLLRLYPQAKVYRTHAEYFSHYLNKDMAVKYKMKINSSICLFGVKNITPFLTRYGNDLIMNTYYCWSDDSELTNKVWDEPFVDYNKILKNNNLLILDFHPKHIANDKRVSAFLEYIISSNEYDCKYLSNLCYYGFPPRTK